MTFSENSKLLAVGNLKIIELFTVKTAKLLETFKGSGTITCISISSHQDYIAAGDKFGCILVWNIHSKNRELLFQSNKGLTRTILFSTDGRYLAYSSAQNLTVWDMTEKSMIASIKSGRHSIGSFTFDLENKSIVYFKDIFNIQCFDLALARKTFKMSSIGGEVYCTGSQWKIDGWVL